MTLLANHQQRLSGNSDEKLGNFRICIDFDTKNVLL